MFMYCKMGFYNIMETSFFVSLGITFVLILLLVYHFKQRLGVTEAKQDTMFEIINNIAQEITNIKSGLLLHGRHRDTPHPISEMIHNEERNQVCEVPIHGTNSDIICDDDTSDDESYSDDDSDDEYESDDDQNKIVVSDDETLVVEEIIIPSNTDENVPATVDEIDIEINVVKNETPDFSKMNLGTLRAYISDKGWTIETSKMKKAQVIEVIHEHLNA